ncbi:MAG: AI-2E family transporter [Steroidobacterales bacterium]
MTSHPDFYPRVFALAVVAVLGYLLIRILAPFAEALSWAAFLAFLLFPLNVRLRRRLRGRRAAAAGVLTILVPLGVLLPLSALSVEFVAQIASLSVRVQAAATRVDVHSFADLERFAWFTAGNSWLATRFSVSATTIQGWLVSGTRSILEHAAGLGGTVFLGAVSSLFGVLLTLFLLFFFLCDGDAIVLRARALIPLTAERTERLFRRLAGIARAIVFGMTLMALLEGLLLGVGFWAVGLPSPVVFGVLGALVAMLPVGGTTFIWAPASAWLFIDHQYGAGSVMLIWGLVLLGFDNVLKPLLISGRAPVSMLVVFLGVLGGISAFGAIGMIAGPILLSLAVALLEFAEEERGSGTV